MQKRKALERVSEYRPIVNVERFVRSRVAGQPVELAGAVAVEVVGAVEVVEGRDVQRMRIGARRAVCPRVDARDPTWERENR